MDGKICLVTGGNAGIGKATALGLAQLGATVVIVARARERGETAVADIQRAAERTDVGLLLADLSSQEQIRQLAEEFGREYGRLDVLVNNAGIIPQSRQLSEDGLEMQFAVNHMAYFLLTHLLLDMLKNSTPSRIINVSSMVHGWSTLDFDDLQNEKSYQPTRVYAQTKLMNVLFTYELARRLAGSGVTANCLHPGVIGTRLNAHYAGRIQSGDASLSELMRGAATSIYLASSPEVADVTGRYFVDSEERRSTAVSYDEAIAQKLWEISVDLIGKEI